MTDYLFVYGTLRSDYVGRASGILKNRAHLVGQASTAGRLYKIDWYPGMIAAENQIDRVIGEVFAFSDPALLAELDRFEEISPANDETGEYRRLRQLVHLSRRPAWEESERETWVYLYNGQVAEDNRILSGDFVRSQNTPAE